MVRKIQPSPTNPKEIAGQSGDVVPVARTAIPLRASTNEASFPVRPSGPPTVSPSPDRSTSPALGLPSRTCIVRASLSSRPSTGRVLGPRVDGLPVWHALCSENWTDQHRLGRLRSAPRRPLPWTTGPGDHRGVGMTPKGRTVPLQKDGFSQPASLFPVGPSTRGLSSLTRRPDIVLVPGWKTLLTGAERRRASYPPEGGISPRPISNFHGFDATSSGQWFLKLISEANSDTFVFMKSTPVDHRIR